MPMREDPRLHGRDGDIWRAYLFGHSQERIAKDHGISQQRVSQILTDIRSSIPDSNKTDAALLDLDRLNTLLAGVMPAAAQGDTKASAAALRILERRAKMLGLDTAEPLQLVIERHRELEGRLVADALAAALDALDLTEDQRITALSAAQQRLLDTPQDQQG